MDERSYVDFVFHPQIFTEEQIEEIPGYAEQFGIRSFKFYMSGMPGIVKSVTDDVLLKDFVPSRRSARTPSPAFIVRPGALIDRARNELKARKPQWHAGRLGGCTSCRGGSTRDPDRALSGQIAGAHLYVVTCPAGRGSKCSRRAARRQAFTVETTTPYLGINSGDPNGFLAKMVPPVRTPEHQAALWEGLLEGSINTVGTDNTSRALATKTAGSRSAWRRDRGCRHSARICPRLLHYGHERGVPFEILIERATRSPARVYGIYPQKGTIAVGSDADLVVVDLEQERVVRARTCRECRISPRSKANSCAAGRSQPSRLEKSLRGTARSSARPTAAICPASPLRRSNSIGSDAHGHDISPSLPGLTGNPSR